ncbi:transcriptional regulator, TetR family [Beutenbergia cavernae DSM 12333]|uniref:Transcriptional regulator, TetR family n=1 Tax=Beutenbergia cavernae (strain ATCC BAA-8 / DSM 12333 / CCUG 43141 / JCM 11478 / NBRC 16432 / NCIMB 13614 / HKI 0122) TaxID=471853 RepID=C5C4J8_BEUC1|nr:TetR/AcrR family transcriptional regulator [Beutenbergia cavernae]ACQ82122.1 transcriptional regulator, TetR family [Beutenbergia cavernae DSM 12333]
MATTSGGSAAHPGASRRADAKRHQILVAAREVFLDRGFAGASMDEVAARAGASKVTVYAHVRDKRSLFEAVVQEAIDEAEESTRDLVGALGESHDLPSELRAFARAHVREVLQPHLVRMRRLIIAESPRFPELAQAWHRGGPVRGHATLAGAVARLAERGMLSAPDPLLAAQHLNYLILAVPLNEAMFTGVDAPYGPRKLNRFADEGVRVFLAAYAA